MYPLKLKPAVKDYIWGGTDLILNYGKTSDKDIIAETWELSLHDDGLCVVENGEFAGKTLKDVLAVNNYAGENCKAFDMFPVLIKLINSKDKLSIQVHPSDEYALKNEGQYGKSEMWYVAYAKEGSGIYYGFKKDTTKQEYIDSIKNNVVTELLNFVPVKAGEAYFIESGTVHAICEGLVIWELQQNSNITYRVYDYDRRDKNGNARDLHIKKAVEVSTLSKKDIAPCKVAPNGLLCKCKYFSAYYNIVKAKANGNVTNDSFFAFTVISGEGEIDGVLCKTGETVFLPAGYGKYVMCGNFEYLACKIDKH